MQYEDLLEKLHSLSDPQGKAGMARYGINTQSALGISLYTLRPLAKETGKDHLLAQQLWDSGIHEARILASMVDDPRLVDEEQMESWVSDFDSWDICDQTCSNLFDKTALAYQKTAEWSERTETFVKRAGFALMAALSVHDKKASDEKIAAFLPVILRESTDDRNFVKKAVNWALRQVGKRNLVLNALAIETAQEIKNLDARAARWIASDALRELTSDKVQQRLRK
ncbi:MAG: DNA alkylation repair protein [Chloroflexota bacterium]|nr:MAG: DNA alkylation repair protein [Chloroflexota bacterium]